MGVIQPYPGYPGLLCRQDQCIREVRLDANTMTGDGENDAGTINSVCPSTGRRNISGVYSAMPLQGVIFDLDGTLIDSNLDFNLIRKDLGIPDGQPILEHLGMMESGEKKARLLSRLREHELAGADRALLMPGVEDFLNELGERDLFTGVLTRNSREAANRSLKNLKLAFTHVLTREDCSYKPDPAGLLSICQDWKIEPSQVLYFGDYLFDLQAGRNAGMPTVLYSPQELPDYAHLADYTISHFSEAVALVDRILANEIP